MPCQVLAASLTEASRPSGSLAESARPIGDGLCRTYDFTPPTQSLMVTFGGDPMVDFDGNYMVTMI
jgi:hypothetical protein